ncbi:MAG TPA: DHA2 family efflux MFS transporter permease subunit [Jatrophihabitans sp.]|nr:DHA2 family efflux MFS transporter permease subunit [Jatrophihabitans sp.]
MTDTKTGRAGRTHAGATGARRAAHPALILLVIAGAQLMVVLDSTIVNIALPHMGEYFHKSQTNMTWALNAYSLAFGGLLLLGGRSGDILGRRRMFMIGLSLFTIGSFLGGIAESFPMLLVGRAVQGVGGAIAAPTALSLITVEFKEGRERTRAMAVYAAVSGAGAALGLLLGGILTNYLSWRWVLFVNVPIGIALITGAALYLGHSERLRGGRFDFLGALLSVGWSLSVVYGLIRAANHGWSDNQTITAIVLGGVLLLAFVVWEARGAAEPMMPLRIFENRNRSGAYTVMLVIGAAMFGMFYFITFFVQLVRDYGPLKTGVAFLPVAVVIGITSQVVAKTLPKVGPKVHVVIGTVLLTAALLWLSTVDVNSGYLTKLLPGMLVLAVAMGNLFVPLMLTAVSKVAPTDAGLASALLNVGQQLGGAIGLSVMTTVFGTAARDYVTGHGASLFGKLAQLSMPQSDKAALAQTLQHAGSGGLQPEQIKAFVAQHPASAPFFAKGGVYQDFSHHLIAHASGQGFLAGTIIAAVAVVAAVLLINVKKSEVPSEPGAMAAAA